jgi:hypothetical protein
MNGERYILTNFDGSSHGLIEYTILILARAVDPLLIPGNLSVSSEEPKHSWN